MTGGDSSCRAPDGCHPQGPTEHLQEQLREAGECRCLPSCGHRPTSTLRDRDFMSVCNLSYRKRGFLNVVVVAV